VNNCEERLKTIDSYSRIAAEFAVNSESLETQLYGSNWECFSVVN
jgi:hypothetical protein